MKYKIYIQIMLVAIFFNLVTACSYFKKDKISGVEGLDADQLYQQGIRFLESSQYKKARGFFVTITTEYPYSQFASKSQYLEALTSYKIKDYESALISADEYIELYPSGENIEDAYYLSAIIHYDQISQINLDQKIAQEGLDQFNILLKKFPNGQYAQDARLKLDLIKDQLAGKEMVVGRFYHKKHNLTAAINRYNTVVQEYQTTEFIQEALFRLIECYLALGDKEEAIKYGSILGANYPESSWYHEGYKLLKSN